MDTRKQPGPPTIGRKVASLRVLAGWTQRELAERARLARTAVSRVELDLHKPHRATLAVLADALGVTVDELQGPGEDGAGGDAS